jgi:hypothetical protein
VDRIKKALIDRDGISENEAEEVVQELAQDAEEVVMNGDINGIEDLLLEHGLDADFEEDILMSLIG